MSTVKDKITKVLDVIMVRLFCLFVVCLLVCLHICLLVCLLVVYSFVY